MSLASGCYKRGMRKVLLAFALGLLCAGCSTGQGGQPCGTCTGGTVPFTNVDSCHCCLPPGAACTSDSQCCAGCNNGHCGCLAGAQTDGGAASVCGNAKVCCSGQCTAGTGSVCK